MRPNAIYNFVRLLEALRDHDWTAEPYILLIGEKLSGKSTIHWQLLRLLKEAGLLISLDGRETRHEDHLVQRALVRANHDELRASRITLQSTQARTVIVGSSFPNSTVRINSTGRSLFKRPEVHQVPASEGATAMVSTLISDVIAVRRDAYVVVDHFDEAERFVRRFVEDTALRMGGMGTLRIMLVGTKDKIAQDPLAGIAPAVYEVPKLDVDDIRDWARQLGLRVSEDNARMLHALTEKGLAGAIRTELMKLLADDEWRATAGSARAT